MGGRGHSTGPLDGLSPEAYLYARHNFRLGVANGVVGGLLDPLIGGMVVTLFAARLGASATLLGLIATLGAVGGVLPQMLVAGYIRGRGRVMPLYARASVVRVIGVAWMALSAVLPSVLFAGTPGVGLLGLLMIGYALYMFASGVSSLPFIEVVGKTIPPRRRGTFFSMRQLGGGLAGLITSLGTAAVVSERLPWLAFPYNFGLLFGAGTLAAALTFWLWTRVREPELHVEAAPPTPSPRASARTHAPALPGALRAGVSTIRIHPDFRRFLALRLLLTLAAMAGPFYLVHARQLGVPMDILGAYVTVALAASMLSNLMWGPLVNRRGHRTLLSLAVLSALMVPLTALLVPVVGRVLLLSPQGLGMAYALVFALGGLGGAGQGMIFDSVLLSLAPSAERPTYFGFVNTMCGVVAFFMPLGGVLVDWLGYDALFGLSLMLSLAALVAGMRVGVRPSPARATAPAPETGAGC